MKEKHFHFIGISPCGPVDKTFRFHEESKVFFYKPSIQLTFQRISCTIEWVSGPIDKKVHYATTELVCLVTYQY